MGPSVAGERWGGVASAHKAFSGPIRLLPEVEQFWSWFSALPTTSNAPLPREPEAAQTLLGQRASIDLREKPESAAFLSKHALGLSLVSRGEFHFRECSCQKLDLCLFCDGPLVGLSLAGETWAGGAVHTRPFQAPYPFSLK